MSRSSEQLWTVREVAAFLSVSRSWVYHRAEEGELPCLRFGGHLRFDPQAVRLYLRSRGKTVSVLRRELLGDEAPAGTRG